MAEQSASADGQRTTTKSDNMSSDKDEYMIQPLDMQKTESYESLLFGVVPKSDVYTSASKRFGVLYWAVLLTPEQAKRLQHPSVCRGR